MNNKIISGALFDFMGWLTTRPKRIMLSSVDDAAPAADAIKEFAKMRGLSLDDARVQDWREALAQERSSDEQPAQQKPVSRVLSQQEMAEAAKRYTSPPAQRQAQSADTWVGLTDEDYLEAIDEHPYEGCDRELWLVLEAKLKEKNT